MPHSELIHSMPKPECQLSERTRRSKFRRRKPNLVRGSSSSLSATDPYTHMTEMISDSQLPPSPQTPKPLPEQVEKFFQACNKCEDLSTPKSTFLTHKAIFAATVLENSINYHPPDRNTTLLASVHELHLVSHEKLANEYEDNITKIRQDAQKAVELLVGLIRDVLREY